MLCKEASSEKNSENNVESYNGIISRMACSKISQTQKNATTPESHKV